MRVVAGEDLIEVAEEFGLEGEVEFSGRGDDAFEFEIGQQGGDDERSDIAGGGKFVNGYGKFIAKTKDAVDETAHGMGGRSVAVDEVFEGNEIVAAGEQFAGGRCAVASGAANFL